MEFPDLGKHCFEPTCKQLDFLPLKCDACEQIFCKDHVTYEQHKCSSAYKKDVQVPVCPLCNIPIPVTRGQTPDIVVGEHIDRDCKSDPAQQKRKNECPWCSAAAAAGSGSSAEWFERGGGSPKSSGDVAGRIRSEHGTAKQLSGRGGFGAGPGSVGQ
ncbi:AN1-type zinc finger protein 2B isoform X2 [Ascaphus truei]|uniref:AN1-type zinc finger protein 2B isoform X2 n=1 Tax=Ascaphus truei TaxID=8439 RepID=UPI003F5AC0E4